MHVTAFYYLQEKGQFVAAFAQANEGDVSPNTAGPRCLDTGKPCDKPHSTCNGRVKLIWRFFSHSVFISEFC